MAKTEGNKEMMKDIFCAREQIVTPHRAEVDQNGEFVFYCTSVTGKDEDKKPIYCDGFVKFPADIDPKKFEKAIEAHEEANTGQVSIEKSQEKLGELLGVSLKNADKPK